MPIYSQVDGLELRVGTERERKGNGKMCFEF